MKMSKKKAIEIIEETYPADSFDDRIKLIGRDLLARAKEEVGFNWRSEDKKVLVRCALLCLEEASSSVK